MSILSLNIQLRYNILSVFLLLAGFHFQACYLDEEDFSTLEFFETTTDSIAINGDKLSLKAFVSGLEQNTELHYGYLFFEVGSDTPIDSIIGIKTFTPPQDNFDDEKLINFGTEPPIEELENLNVLCNYQVQAFAYQAGGRRAYGEKLLLVFTNEISFNIFKDDRSISNDTMVLAAAIFGLEDWALEVDEHGYFYAAASFDEDSLADTLGTIPLGPRQEDGAFERVEISGLDFNTPYFARAFINLDGKYYLSREDTFHIRDGWAFLENRNFGIAHGIAVSLNDKAYFGLGSDSGFSNPNGQLWSIDVNRNINPVDCSFPGIPRTSAIAFAIEDTIYYGLGSLRISPPTVFKDLWAFYPNEASCMEQWKQLLDDPFPGGPRHAAVAFTIGRKAYVGTGWDENEDEQEDFYVFDPTQEAGHRWSPVASMPSEAKRANAVAFAINGKGYVGLGFGSGGEDLRHFWEFTPDDSGGQWQRLEADLFPGVNRVGAISFTIENKAYVGSGSKARSLTPSHYYRDFWQFDPESTSSSRWSKITTFAGERRTGAMGFALNQKGYMFGGERIGDDGLPQTFFDFWEYIPATP